MASVYTVPDGSPFFADAQVVPPLTLLKTPLSVAA